MTDVSAFDAPDDLLRRIIDQPEDDSPRLALADWFDTQSEPRGEFIRVQCELARTDLSDQRRADLEGREAELLDQNREAWTKPLTSLGIDAEEVGFRRGMIESVTLDDFDLFLDRGDELLEAAPLLNDVAFNNVVNAVLGNRLDADLLAQSLNLARLKSLSLMQCGLESDGIEILAESPNVGNLERLIVFGDPIGDAGAAALAASASLPRLSGLTLVENEIGANGIAELVRSPLAVQLISLWLGGNPIGAEGIQAIASSAELANLQELTLADVGVGPAEAEALAASNCLANLKNLIVTDEFLTDDGEQALRKGFGDRYNRE